MVNFNGVLGAKMSKEISGKIRKICFDSSKESLGIFPTKYFKKFLKIVIKIFREGLKEFYNSERIFENYYYLKFKNFLKNCNCKF